MAYTVSWDMVSSLARNLHIPKLQDQFFLSNALLSRWKNRQKNWEGGPVLVVPLSFAPEGGGGTWYSGSDKFDTTVRNPIKAANYFAKNAEVTLAIDSDEELAVRGPQSVLNLVDSKMTIAQNTMTDLVGTALFNTGTNAKAVGGLGIALSDNIDGTTATTYGGITAGNQSPLTDPNGWWQHNADHTAYATGSLAADSTLFPPKSTTGGGGSWGPLPAICAKTGFRSGKQPTLLVSNWGAWTDFHNALAKNERYDRPQQGSDLAKAGFTNLMFRNMPWVVDERAPHNSSKIEKIYGIDERAVSLYVHPSRNFSFKGWRDAYDQDVRAGYIFHRTELCFSERRSSFVIDNIDATNTLNI
jgi:hypothetical protein